MRIAVFGNYGVNNIGDDLILMGLKKQLKGHELVVFCGRPEQIKPQFDLEAHTFFPGGIRSGLKVLISPKYRKQVKKSHEALNSVDLIIIGGGGILVDQRLAAVMLWHRQLKKISRTGIPFQFLGNSFELQRSWSRNIFRNYLKQAEKITVRDSASLQFIQSMGLKAELVDDFALLALHHLQPFQTLRTSLAPVLSFRPKSCTQDVGPARPCPSLSGRRTEGGEESLSDAELMEKDLASSTTRKICLALCRTGINRAQLAVLRKFIEKRKNEGYEIVALAFQTTGDDDRKLYRKLDPTLKVAQGLENVFQELRNCQLLIGMRFHSLLLALHLDIPVIALAYQQKVSNLMADSGLSSLCIPVQNLDEQKLQELFLKLIEIE